MSKIINLFKNDNPRTRENVAMDAESFRTDVIRPALKITQLWSPSAENLLLGTALVESGLKVIKQFQDGPAVSFYQIEPATYYDVIKYLGTRQKTIKDAILSACYLETFPDASALIWNLRLATLIARAIYYRRREPLPESNDVVGMGQYWKDFFNVSQGKGTVQRYVEVWEKNQ